MPEKRITIGLRLGTMLLDHFIMCFIIVPPLIVLGFLVKSEPHTPAPVETISFYIMAFVYLNKDFARGKSISKRILGLRVIDRQTGEPASSFKCFLRNITLPVWPIEVFVSLFSPTRRIGDLIANTKIELSTKEEVTSIFLDLKATRFAPSHISILMVGVIYMGALWYVMDNLFGH